MVITARLQKRPQLRAVVTKPQSGGGYSEGYEAGKEAGYQDGYKAGHTAGDAEGYDRGYNLGYNNGYDTGHSMGYAEGWDAGYARGYDEGYAKGKADVEAQNAMILTDINTALVEKGAESADTLQDVPEKIGSIQAGGGDSWYDTFWDVKQNNGEPMDCSYAYYGAGWNDANFNPKHNFRPTGLGYAFAYSQITDIAGRLESLGKTFDTSNMTGGIPYVLNNSYSKTFPTINCINLANLNDVFRYAKQLRTASFENVKATQQWINAFASCGELVDLNIEGVIGQSVNFDCGKLSKSSILNIFAVLSTTASGMSVTFKATAINAAFGGTASEEWQALIATRSNWTVSVK